MIPTFVRKTTWVFALGVLVGGCMTWQASDPGELEVVPTEMPPKVRVTRTDGAQVELEKAELNGDTIVGFVPGFVSCDARIGVPMDDVQAMETWRTRPGTALGPIWGLFVAFVVGMVSSQDGRLEGY